MITFTWEDSGTGGPASGYHFILTGTQVITLTTAVTSTSMSLTPGMYTWSVSAFNDGGSSAYASDRNLLVEHRVFLPLILK